MRADVLDEVPFLLQQVLLVGRDEDGGLALDHRDEVLQILQVDVQCLCETAVKIYHLIIERLEEVLVLVQVMHGRLHPADVLLSVAGSQLQSILALPHQLSDTQLRRLQGLLLQSDLEALEYDVLKVTMSYFT